MGSVSGFSFTRLSHPGSPLGTAWEISHELFPASVLQAGSSAEAKLALALTSVNPIFSSQQQQQEALPDETEVVEETVAEVSEVGGWWLPPLPAPCAFPLEPRLARRVSC